MSKPYYPTKKLLKQLGVEGNQQHYIIRLREEDYLIIETAGYKFCMLSERINGKVQQSKIEFDSKQQFLEFIEFNANDFEVTQRAFLIVNNIDLKILNRKP
jgi:hypothetical protein